MPVDWSKYPKNFGLLRGAVMKRAGFKCERCGVSNYERGYRLESGEFVTAGLAPPGYKLITIVLSTVHLDQNPENNDMENLMALCQRCHLLHDLNQHIASGHATRRRLLLAAAGALTACGERTSDGRVT